MRASFSGLITDDLSAKRSHNRVEFGDRFAAKLWYMLGAFVSYGETVAYSFQLGVLHADGAANFRDGRLRLSPQMFIWVAMPIGRIETDEGIMERRYDLCETSSWICYPSCVSMRNKCTFWDLGFAYMGCGTCRHRRYKCHCLRHHHNHH